MNMYENLEISDEVLEILPHIPENFYYELFRLKGIKAKEYKDLTVQEIQFILNAIQDIVVDRLDVTTNR